MTELQQFVYISRANFAASREGLGVEPEVARILIQSRLNNPRRGLVGALYYGDGCFFQCLEGPAQAIDALYADLLRDPRHRDLKVLQRRSIRGLSFSEWAMKYVPGAADVRALMKQRRQARFDPYRFDPATVDAMVDLLRRGAEGAVAPPRAAPRRPNRPIARATIVAVALLAILVVIIALYR